MTAAEAYAMADRHGWLPAVRGNVAQAPPLPDSAVALLRAAAFPARREDRRAS